MLNEYFNLSRPTGHEDKIPSTLRPEHGAQLKYNSKMARLLKYKRHTELPQVLS